MLSEASESQARWKALDITFVPDESYNRQQLRQLVTKLNMLTCNFHLNWSNDTSYKREERCNPRVSDNNANNMRSNNSKNQRNEYYAYSSKTMAHPVYNVTLNMWFWTFATTSTRSRLILKNTNIAAQPYWPHLSLVSYYQGHQKSILAQLIVLFPFDICFSFN